MHGIDNFLRSEEKSYIAILSDGCPPIPGISRERNAFNCNPERHSNVLTWFIKQTEINELVWVGRFRSISGNSKAKGFFLDGLEPSLSMVEGKIEQTINSLLDNGKRTVSYTHLTLPTILRV